MLVPRATSQIVTTPKALLKCNMERCRFVSGLIDSSERDRLNGNTKILRPGLILGHNTSTKRWYICWGSKLSAAEAAAQTTLSVTTGEGNTRFAALDNAKIVGPGGSPEEQDIGSLSSVAANTVTATTGLYVGYPTGSYVYRSEATDYDADIAQGILFEFTSVDDGLGGAAHAQAIILTHGVVDEDELIGATDLWIGQLRDATVGDIAHRVDFES